MHASAVFDSVSVFHYKTAALLQAVASNQKVFLFVFRQIFYWTVQVYSSTLGQGKNYNCNKERPLLPTPGQNGKKENQPY